MAKQIEVNGKTYERCTESEWYNNHNTLTIRIEKRSKEDIYYKEVQKFPIIFEDKHRKCEVQGDGRIKIIDKDFKIEIYFKDSFHILKEAIDKAIEIRNG